MPRIPKHKSPKKEALLSENLRQRLAELSTGHRAWVWRAVWYAEHGYANEKCLEILTEGAHWKSEWDRRIGYERFRRVCDCLVGLVALVLLLPLLALIALILKLEGSGSPIFIQLRVGRFGEMFWVYKFRTMHLQTETDRNDYPPPLEKSVKTQNISRLGNWLRNHKLDELPQLLNVVKGDMSMVGPRPLSVSDAACIPGTLFSRFAIRPGLTGLSQVMLPNDVEPIRKLEVDCVYVKHRNWLLDLRLFFSTLRVVFSGEKRYKGTRIHIG